MIKRKAKQPIDELEFRYRVTRGWNVRPLPDKEKFSIAGYLKTGNPANLPEQYRVIREGMIQQNERYKDNG
jgi:hypothetical protein